MLLAFLVGHRLLKLWCMGSGAHGLSSCDARVLVAECGILVPLTRDQTRAPCIGSVESYPLDHQGSPTRLLLEEIFVSYSLTVPPSFCLSPAGRKKGNSFSLSEVTQSCPTLWDPMDCSPSGSSVHGILQARIPLPGGLPFPSPGDLPNLGFKPRSPALRAYSLSSELPGSPRLYLRKKKSHAEVK